MDSISRRDWLAAATASTLALPTIAAEPNQPRTANPRLIFNCDGSMVHCWGKTLFPESKGPLTRDQFVSLVFTPIDGTPVDTLMFSFGSGNVAEYESHVLEWPGQADNFKFPESRRWHGGIEVDPQDQYRNPKSLADAGHNPPKIVVEECRKRGLRAFVSLRMNDTHDGQHPRGKLPNPELPTFKRQNLHWLVENLDRWTALDFRHPQVRKLKLRVIEEFFDRWDFDGIELDWLRHTLNFPRGTERESARFLTEFMTDVRRSLQARARKRKRPIQIAVRVPERLTWCQLGGYDIPAWIDNDLCDMLILGQGLTEAPQLSEFRALMTQRQIPIYPSLYAYGNGYAINPDEVVRANAANLWRDGASGLYTFNWYHHGTWKRELLKQVASAEKLRTLDKQYTLPHKFDVGRSVGTDYLRFNTPYRAHQVPFDLDRVGGEKQVRLRIAQRPKTAVLWVGLHYVQPGDVISAYVNGRLLEPNDIKVAEHVKRLGFQIKIPHGSGMIGFPRRNEVAAQFSGISWAVPPDALKVGDNVVGMRLIKRGAGSDKQLQVSRVELAARE